MIAYSKPSPDQIKAAVRFLPITKSEFVLDYPWISVTADPAEYLAYKGYGP
jgi:hypothetical protein